MRHMIADHAGDRMLLGRREALLGLGAVALTARTGVAFAAGSGNARLVVINARGGLDGLSMIAPYGDPYLAKLRAPLLSGAVGTAGGLFDLGGFYGLHPAMPFVHAMFQRGEALAVHAVGNCGYTRSHFEGQDYLQSGASQLLAGGWLNRAIGLLPVRAGATETGVALGTDTPLLIRGAIPVAGYAPNPFTRPSPALAAAMAQVVAADPLLGPAMHTATSDRTSFAGFLSAAGSLPAGVPGSAQTGWQAGALLRADAGPRVAVIGTRPFDTHDAQASRIATGLAALDGIIEGLKLSLGLVWANTVVMVVTEFGRTAAVNTTGGTDHGTAFAMLLAGGAVAGGRVVGPWPGLAPNRLYQGRDLQPSVDVRSVAMGVLRGAYGAAGRVDADRVPRLRRHLADGRAGPGLTRYAAGNARVGGGRGASP